MWLDFKPKRRAMIWIKGPPRPLQSLSGARIRLPSNSSSVAALLTGRVLIIFFIFNHTPAFPPSPTFQLNRPRTSRLGDRRNGFTLIFFPLVKICCVKERSERGMIGGGGCETRGKIKAEKGVGHRGEIVREGGEERKQSRAPWSRNPKPRQHRRSRNPQTSLPPSHLPRTLLSHHPAPPALSKMCFSCIWSVFPLTDLPRVWQIDIANPQSELSTFVFAGLSYKKMCTCRICLRTGPS